MSFDKAIASGKEHRKSYKGAKAIDCSCRNHGSCEWCKENRLYQYNKELAKMKSREGELYESSKDLSELDI